MTAKTSYNECKCVFCGYQPGVTGRLSMLILNGEPAWACLGCEVQTINGAKTDEG